MQIQLEATNRYSIQSYGENEIKVNNVVYRQNCIISQNKILVNWDVKSIALLNEEALVPLLNLKPEIILIGHEQQGEFLPKETLIRLSKERIGIEIMAIGPACRTFNILLGEFRRVVAGFLIEPNPENKS